MPAPPLLPQEYHGREQSFVKHLILRGYLQRVAWNILSFSDDFTFIDGFSGPWEAKSDTYADTSFRIAIDELRAVKSGFDAKGSNKRLRCVFVEKDADAFAQLRRATEDAVDLQANAIHGTFEDNITEVLRHIDKSFALTFIDPTGWSIDLSRMAPLLQQRGEVLINFMYEHFKRFVEDQRPNIRASYDKPFGGLPWREWIDQEMMCGLDKEAAILETFKRAVKQIGGFKHVASARIRHRRVDKSHFYLVYGTRHPKGLEEFRRVERGALSAEEFYRIEARDREMSATGQDGLFDTLPHNAEETARAHWEAEISAALPWIEEQILRQPSVTFGSVSTRIQERFSVTLPELKDLVVGLKQQGLVELDGLAPKQRKPKAETKIRATSLLRGTRSSLTQIEQEAD